MCWVPVLTIQSSNATTISKRIFIFVINKTELIDILYALVTVFVKLIYISIAIPTVQFILKIFAMGSSVNTFFDRTSAHPRLVEWNDRFYNDIECIFCRLVAGPVTKRSQI